MYTVTVRDHMMIAHSLRGAAFGPSQRLHGATYIVDVSFRGPQLNADGVLVDIAGASDRLRAVLDELDRRNLDEVPEFAGRNSTTETLATHIADRIAEAVTGGAFGPAGAHLIGMTVTLTESPAAWASCERSLQQP
jgi:6-pyruvoyl-tetrahydropterin synthase